MYNKAICMYVSNHYQCFFYNSAPFKCVAHAYVFFPIDFMGEKKTLLRNIRSDADMQIEGNLKIEIDSDRE